MELSDIVKRSVKDSVFTDLFGNKKYLLQLYQSLHPEDTEATEDDLKQITLQNVLTNDLYNDLGMLVDDRLMILVEAQSTWTVNIIVRCIMYLAQTWRDYLNENQLDIYGSRAVKIPEPELYVIYTGDKKITQKEITFSQEFFGGKKVAIDATVQVLTDGREGDILHQYIAFTKVFDAQRKAHGKDTRTAIQETIRICRDQNVLRDYLETREKEVISIMMALFDQEQILRNYIATERLEALQQGEARGRAAGRNAEKRSTAKTLYGMGMPIEQIAKVVQYDPKDVSQWLS